MYILTSDKYKDYVKSEKLRFLPEFLLPSYKPEIIDTITKDGRVIGNVAGINVKPVDLSEKGKLNKYIDSILRVKTDEDTIYIENEDKIPHEIVDYIVGNTGLKSITGYNTKILNIPDIIEEVFKVLGQDYNNKDTLIICTNTNILKDTINVLSKLISFFTVVGIPQDIRDDIYGEVFDASGISIFQPENLDKIIKNYSVIVNFNDVIDFDVRTVRNDALILDFSKTRPFEALNRWKRNIVIEDINFDTALDDNPWLGTKIDSKLIEGLNLHEGQKFRQIKTRNTYFYPREFISKEIKLTGRI